MQRRKTEVEHSITGRFFCSKKCRQKLGAKPRRGTAKPCEWCSKEMYVRPGAVDRQRFCSKKCHDLWQRRNREDRTCETCGTIFDRPPSWETRQVARYCSNRCESLGRIQRPLDRMHNDKPARLDNHGYVWVWEPEHAQSAPYKGWIAEHRLVAEGIIGRELTSEDEVHHINRIRHDNRPENLEVLDGLTHSRITANGRQSDKELLAEYIRRFGPLDTQEERL